MSKISKILLAVGILFLVVAGIARIALTTMHPALYAPLGFGVLAILSIFVIDYKFFYEFFTLKTTKHGINMGWLIVMALVSVFVVNFLAVKYEKKWDFTKEGLNSLSEQSTKILSTLKSPVNFILLYSKQEQAEANKKRVSDFVQLYHEKSQQIHFESYSALNRPDLAAKYEFKNGEIGLYAEYEDRHLKIDNVSEEGITKVLLKLTRDQVSRKTIYFSTGHGERELEGDKPETISNFKTDLETTYNIKTIKLVEGDIPADAAAFAIIGPNQMFLPAEIEKIRKYAMSGGHLFIAADPGEKHNIAVIDKLFGVDFHGDYVLDTRVQLAQVGPIIALGSTHSRTSDITKTVADQLFLLASSLAKSSDAPAEYKYENLVETGAGTQAAAKLEKTPKIISSGPHIIAMQVTGKVDGSAKEFAVIALGDSDFLSNQLYAQYGDRDFALNSISFLAKDEDLISIHPKTPKATKINVISSYKNYLAFILIIAPLLMLLLSGIIWWKRRTA